MFRLTTKTTIGRHCCNGRSLPERALPGMPARTYFLIRRHSHLDKLGSRPHLTLPPRWTFSCGAREREHLLMTSARYTTYDAWKQAQGKAGTRQRWHSLCRQVFSSVVFTFSIATYISRLTGVSWEGGLFHHGCDVAGKRATAKSYTLTTQ